MSIYKQRVLELRRLMKENNIDAYLILSADPHLSEYLPEYYKNRVFISGFKGSVGTVLITQEEGFLWVDGRYWLQAQKELEGSGILLQKQDAKNTFTKWLEKNLSEDQILGIDFALLPLSLQKDLKINCKANLKHIDLISLLWKDRPTLPQEKIYEHELEYCSYSRKEKLALVRQKMKNLNVTSHLISSLDDIAWLTNLRGNDVNYNPVFLSHLLILEDKALLFVDQKKVNSELEKKLNLDGFWLKNYDEIIMELEKLANTNLLIEPSKMTALLINSLDKASEFRAQSKYYISDSFATIAGFNENAAYPHYKATKESFAYLKKDGLLLIDSGGQYKNGTTDITRVVPIGKANAEQIHDYTLVLKAHIAISSAIFPKDIAMPLLDAITRAPLWKEQIDYIHGTGHGVGYFLNVHEGPQVLSYLSPVLEKTKAKEGMLTSIEPGIYKVGKWGIRLENLVIHTKVENPKNKDFGEFLYFKPVTLCPFEISCINTKMLDEKEKEWLNNYHKEVFEKLSPKLGDYPKALVWLEKRTKAIF